MPSILFVCTANLYRSPLAAAFLRKKLQEIPGGKDYIINSAGTWAKIGTSIIPRTVDDARRFNLDLGNHKSRQVTSDLLAENDLVLAMETGHKEALAIEFPQYEHKIYLLSDVVDGVPYSIPDPFSMEGKFDRNIIDELRALIERGTGKILSLAENLHSPPQSRGKKTRKNNLADTSR
jgi:protein-tyrosine-phosphatase